MQTLFCEYRQLLGRGIYCGRNTLQTKNSEYLTPFKESVTKEVIEFGDRKDFLPRILEIVFDASKFDVIAFLDDVTASRVAVARLADASDIDHQFLFTQGKTVTDFSRRVKSKIFGKNPGHVSVSLKTEALYESKDPLDLSLVVDVFRKNVFVQRASGRSMDKHDVSFPMGPWQHCQETPATFGTFVGRILKLFAGPENGPFGAAAEPLWIEKRPVVVISEQRQLEVLAQVDALARVGAVPNYVSEAINFCNPLGLNVRQNRGEVLRGFRECH